MIDPTNDYTTEQLEADVERGQQLIEEFTTLLSRGAEHLAAASVDVRCGLRAPASFQAAIEREAMRCAKAQETMGIIELRIDRLLSELEHARITEQLRHVAGRTGEEIGRTEDGHYAVLIPWSNHQEIEHLADVLQNAAIQIVADAELEIGTIVTAQSQERPELHAVSRTYGETLSRGR